jgi:hypothetical protein
VIKSIARRIGASPGDFDIAGLIDFEQWICGFETAAQVLDDEDLARTLTHLVPGESHLEIGRLIVAVRTDLEQSARRNVRVRDDLAQSLRKLAEWFPYAVSQPDWAQTAPTLL